MYEILSKSWMFLGSVRFTKNLKFVDSLYFQALSRAHSLFGLAVLPTGGVFPHLPHHLDLASEDSVGHSTCMSVLNLTLTLNPNGPV